MKKAIGFIFLTVLLVSCLFLFAGCDAPAISGTTADVNKTKEVAAALSENQPTPSDIDYSLERYNLIKRAYWVNGHREKARSLPCAIPRPLGYIALFQGNVVVGKFTVDGKVSSLNSYLTPDSEYYEIVYGGTSNLKNRWLADVDGSYGENDSGIFFFTPDGKYVEWTGTYLYSDIPFEIENPVVRYEME